MSEDSIFGGLDVASAADDPFRVEAGVYPTIVTEASVGLTKGDTPKLGLTLKRTITEGTMAGRVLQTWHFIPKVLSPAEYENLSDEEKGKYDNARSFLKKEMLALGIPESRINSVKPQDLLDRPSILTVKWKAGSDYPQIYSRAAQPGEVKVPSGGISEPGGVASNPFD